VKVPNREHTSRPWRIHELTPDFRLEDVWAPPGSGSADDFARVIDIVTSFDPAESSSCAVRTLFAARWKLGELLGLDRPSTGVGARVPTLRDRLPADLRDAPKPEFSSLPFTSLYLLDDEFAAEAANETMHGVLHIGRIPEGADRFRVQVAILVKPNGLLGDAYMAAIKPFRYLFVYPPMLRELTGAFGRQSSGDSSSTFSNTVPSSPG
jgi:hypothetical protein